MINSPPPAIGIGMSALDGVQAAEADWLGATLLVLRESALEWMLQNDDVEDGARNCGVSLDLFRWRVNHTGVSGNSLGRVSVAHFP